MRRWWLVLALLLSVGINIGILATIAFQGRAAAGDAANDDAAREDAAEIVAERFPDDRRDRDDRPRSHDRRRPPIGRMADELGLEGEKRDAFLEVQRAFFDQTLAARSRMGGLQREIRRQVSSESPDRAAIDRLLVELSEAHAEMERAFVNNLLDSRELLDDEQEKQYMRFLHRMRHVRREVEERFRKRWRDSDDRWDRGGPGRRGHRRRGHDRREPPPEPPPGAEPPP